MAGAIESHPLGLPMLEGYNTKVIIKANSFFQSSIRSGRQIKDAPYITRYKFIAAIDNDLNKVNSVEDMIACSEKLDFGIKCEICGNLLYKIVRVGKTDRFRLKKQLILIDNLSKKHYTCYKVNACYRKAGHDVDFTTTTALSSDNNHPIAKFVLPNLKDFFNSIDYYREELSEETKEKYYDSMFDHYNDYIKSFLRKWILSEINKNNLASFMFGFERIKDCLVNINDSRLQNDFIVKIFEIVGVNEIKDRNFLREQE